MAKSPENLVIEHLRAIRGDLVGVKDDLRDIKARLGAIEHHQAGQMLDSVRQSSRLDDLAARLEKVERRLELRDS